LLDLMHHVGLGGGEPHVVVWVQRGSAAAFQSQLPVTTRAQGCKAVAGPGVSAGFGELSRHDEGCVSVTWTEAFYVPHEIPERLVVGVGGFRAADDVVGLADVGS
jgi:hypothetical protein